MLLPAIKILLGLIEPTSGKATVLGFDASDTLAAQLQDFFDDGAVLVLEVARQAGLKMRQRGLGQHDDVALLRQCLGGG